jgi:N-glycosylase/DNA lyase
MMALLATRHGAVIYAEGATKGKDARGNAQEPQRSVPTWHRLPTWSEIAAVPEAELRRCQLGFRARYIHQTAQFIATHPGWLKETEALPYAEAKARLVTLPGVGEKVADCVLLFGAGRLEAFPVDVWILKTMAARYGLEGWKPAQVAQFGRAHFGPLAGLAQQYLFAWERAEARRGA